MLRPRGLTPEYIADALELRLVIRSRQVLWPGDLHHLEIRVKRRLLHLFAFDTHLGPWFSEHFYDHQTGLR